MNELLRDYIIGMPKAENHIHIEGSIPWNLAFSLARKNSVRMPVSNTDELKVWAMEKIQKSGLDGFMVCDRLINSVCVDEEDYESVILELAKEASRQNIIYQEFHLDYPLNAERNIPIEVVMEGYRSGQKKAKELYNLDISFIAGLDRTLPNEKCVEFVKALDKYLDMIDGLGMDCEENGYPCILHRESYAIARDMGLFLTAHAGEAGPVENIWDALNILKCQRIDHGSAAWMDVDLMKHLKDNDILLAMCPFSNIGSKAARSYEEHPFRKFLDYGIPVSISSDDPPYCLSLTEEWLMDSEKMNLSFDEVEKIARNAFAYSIRGKKYLPVFESYSRNFRVKYGIN